MIARILLLLTILIFVGCKENDPISPSNEEDQGGDVVVIPTQPLNCEKWGSLSCQKNRNCVNPVLNMTEAELLSFWQEEFPQVSELVSQYMRSPSIESSEQKMLVATFKCGRLSYQSWIERFSGATLDPNQSVHIADYLVTSIEGFDEGRCVKPQNLPRHIETYFKSSEEYQNECE